MHVHTCRNANAHVTFHKLWNTTICMHFQNYNTMMICNMLESAWNVKNWMHIAEGKANNYSSSSSSTFVRPPEFEGFTFTFTFGFPFAFAWPGHCESQWTQHWEWQWVGHWCSSPNRSRGCCMSNPKIHGQSVSMSKVKECSCWVHH